MLVNRFGGENINWYSEPKYWPYIFVIMNLWKSTGYNMVIYLAAITGMDESLYEAAMLDGASKWQQTRYITIPQLKPVVIIMFILGIGRIFYSDFGLFWQLTRGIPGSLYEVASTFDTYLYVTMKTTSIGRVAAAAFFQSAVCAIMVIITNLIVKKVDPESGII